MEQIPRPWQSWQRHYTLPKIKVIRKWRNSWCRKVPRWNQGSFGSCGDPYWYDGATCHAYDVKEREYPTSFLRNGWWQLNTQNCFWKGQRYTYISSCSLWLRRSEYPRPFLRKWKKLPNRNMQEPLTSLKKVRNPNYYRHIFDESERNSCHFPLLNINMKFHLDLEELNTQDHFWLNKKW